MSRLSKTGRDIISKVAKKTYAEGRLNKRSPSELRAMWQASNEVTRGSNGFGRQARGRPDHSRALTWIIQSPEGNRYIIKNLVEWCRQNHFLFPETTNGKLPTWKRAADGLRVAFNRNQTWYEWSVISCSEPT